MIDSTPFLMFDQNASTSPAPGKRPDMPTMAIPSRFMPALPLSSRRGRVPRAS